MVSDYFVCKNKDENKAVEEVAKRISDLKSYIRTNLLSMPKDNHWFTASIYDAGLENGIFAHQKDHFYVSTYLFEKIKTEWTMKTKIKLDEQDWRYLIYMVVKDLGYVVSYANGTLGIHQDIPPIIMNSNFEQKKKNKK